MIGTHFLSSAGPWANRLMKSSKRSIPEIWPVSYPKRKPPIDVTTPKRMDSAPQSAPLTLMDLENNAVSHAQARQAEQNLLCAQHCIQRVSADVLGERIRLDEYLVPNSRRWRRESGSINTKTENTSASRHASGECITDPGAQSLGTPAPAPNLPAPVAKVGEAD